MLEIVNLKYCYQTKKGKPVQALKGVNFTLGDSGMYFIGGKSGCGKSTLLNLLGGLAKIQEGDIRFNGVSLKEFSAVEYDAYRASEVGIIFQEFNLIDNLTVGENIELQLNIARANADSEVIAESLKRVDLEGYEDRLPNELSGGEKQRVAIARQLAKGAKVILADEPTGNLDSENATNVFEILKNLSKEIAVVVVSHDMESAYNYGDEIITLKDGLIEKIEVQNKKPQTAEKKEKHVYKAVKPHFPFKYTAKLASKNIFKRKIRFTISLVLSLVSCVMFCILGSVLTVNANRSLADKMYEDDMPFYMFKQSLLESEQQLPSFYSERMLLSSRKEIESKYNLGTDFLYSYFTMIEISGADDIKNVLGYDMIGEYLPLDEDSVYITDFLAITYILKEEKYLDGEDRISLSEDAEVADLVGKTMVIENSNIKVAGIIETDYERYGLLDRLKQEIELWNKAGQYIDEPLSLEQEEMRSILSYYYVNKEYVEREVTKTKSMFFSENDASWAAKLDKGDNFTINDQHFGIYFTTQVQYENYNGWLFTSNGFERISEMEDFSLEDNQVVLARDDYASIFGEKLKFSDYFDEELIDISYDFMGNPVSHYRYNPKNVIPPRIGESITLSLNLNSIGERIEKEVTVVGVIFPGEDFLCRGTYVSDATYFDFVSVANKTAYRVLMKKPATKEQSYEYVSFFREYDIFAISNYTFDIVFQGRVLWDIRMFFIVFGSAFLVVALLIFINYISSVVADSKKTIGIIRAIGGTGGSIFKIYYGLGVLFWLITFVVSAILYMIALPLLNKVFTVGVLEGVQFLYYSIAAIGLVALLLFAVMTLASFLPILKVSRKSPMEVISDK